MVAVGRASSYFWPNMVKVYGMKVLVVPALALIFIIIAVTEAQGTNTITPTIAWSFLGFIIMTVLLFFLARKINKNGPM